MAVKVAGGRAGWPSVWTVTVSVYALSKLPAMTMWEVLVLPATVQTESIVVVVPDFCTSRFEQSPWGAVPARVCMARSVAASTHCCIFTDLSPMPVVISHSPALRVGKSSAEAGIAQMARSNNAAPDRPIAP